MTGRQLLCSALMLGMMVSTASAYNGGGYGFGLGYMYGSLEYKVPYFAAHPPVYYSAPVPRTYGHSPFAYPPHFRTPELVSEVQPLEIVNPYVPSSSTQPAAVEDQVTQSPAKQPLVIENPFVKSTVMTASHSL